MQEHSAIEFLSPEVVDDQIDRNSIFDSLDEIEQRNGRPETLGVLYLADDSNIQQNGEVQSAIYDWRTAHSDEQNWHCVGIQPEKGEFNGDSAALEAEFLENFKIVPELVVVAGLNKVLMQRQFDILSKHQ